MNRQTNPSGGIGKWKDIYGIFERTISCEGISAGLKVVLEKFRLIAPDDEQTYQLWNKEFKAMELDMEYENLATQFIFEYYMDALWGKSLYVNVVKMLVFLIMIKVLEMLEYHEKKELTIEDRVTVIVTVSRAVRHTELLELLAEHIVENNERMRFLELISVLD